MNHPAPPFSFFTRADARAWGLDERAIDRAARSGEWHRIRRGYYTSTRAWMDLDDVRRHRLRARAVLHSLGDGVALSHVSAVLEHGIATWRVPLDRVHVTRLDAGASRIEKDLVHHRGARATDELVMVDGLPCLSAARCALEAGTLVSAERALVMLDSALFTGKATEQQLAHQFELMRHWPHTQHLHLPIRMADSGGQSPGESRARWLFRWAGIPSPVTQFEVRDRHGVVIGISDWAWPNLRMLGEFDGREKYGRLLAPGQTPGDAVFAEKRREDRLRGATGFGMVRLTWSDLEHPRETAQRLRHHLGLGAA
jgi:Transcriptional regulator, AbiEi antitoxin